MIKTSFHVNPYNKSMSFKQLASLLIILKKLKLMNTVFHNNI